ncbi:hypothetical protein [Nocardia brasiliensis]|uniref:hypothetical protein n=1 Tax=Nocardia brasiliensis TaxID=37326 RepID=UPI003D941280
MSVVVTATGHLQAELQQCRAALLYADTASLLSPMSALLASAAGLIDLRGEDALRIIAGLPDRFFAGDPRLIAAALDLRAMLARLPSLHDTTAAERRRRTETIAEYANRFEGIRQHIVGNTETLLREQGFAEIQQAITAGVLTLDTSISSEITDYSTTSDVSAERVVRRLQDILTSGKTYPLFDETTSGIVRTGVSAGIFTPVPVAERLGRDAAMAQGLFDRLPNFVHATTSEILDIRKELASPLHRFRQGVRDLTNDLQIPAEDVGFAAEVHDAWNLKVAPALVEIEEIIANDTSLRRLAGWRDAAGRLLRDPLSVPLATGPGIAVAISPLVTVTAVAATGALGITRIAQSRRDHRDEQKNSQFYFLYGANESLRPR